MNVSNGLLINLRVIASVCEHERITSLDGAAVDVCRQGTLSSIRRWMRGEDRHYNLNTVELILKEAFDVIGGFLSRVDTVEVVEPDDVNYIRRVSNGLRNAVKGLESLKITYDEDLRTKARLDTFMDSIDEQLTKLSEFVKETTVVKIKS